MKIMDLFICLPVHSTEPETCIDQYKAPLANIHMQLILARRRACIILYLVQSICGSAAELLLQRQ